MTTRERCSLRRERYTFPCHRDHDVSIRDNSQGAARNERARRCLGRGGAPRPVDSQRVREPRAAHAPCVGSRAMAPVPFS